MMISETGRDSAAQWRRSCFGIGAAAVSAVVVAAAVGAPVWLVAGFAAAFLLALTVYAAAPGRGRPAATPAARESARAPAGLSDAAHDTLEYVGDPILILDLAGRVVFANRAAHAVVGPDTERKHISAVLRRPELLEAVERVTGNGETERVVFTLPVPMERHFEASIARITQARAPSVAILVHIRDTTAIRRSEETRADFIANASHELRTPLAAVSGFIDTLRGHARNDADARERFLEIMSVEAGRMRRLIDDLLSLTRIELNEHNPPSGEVDVVAVARAAAEALSPLAEAERVRVTIAPHAVLKVVGERDELIQVFQNLVHNAIKYGRPGGEVRVGFGTAHAESRRENGELVFVAVADEGEGIPREAIPRLTERFYRVDIKRSRERGGTGLGLAIVKHILNRHHGRLQIESIIGVGSTFTVFLPAPADAPPVAAEHARSAVS